MRLFWRFSTIVILKRKRYQPTSMVLSRRRPAYFLLDFPKAFQRSCVFFITNDFLRAPINGRAIIFVSFQARHRLDTPLAANAEGQLFCHSQKARIKKLEKFCSTGNVKFLQKIMKLHPLLLLVTIVQLTLSFNYSMAWHKKTELTDRQP